MATSSERMRAHRERARCGLPRLTIDVSIKKTAEITGESETERLNARTALDLRLPHSPFLLGKLKRSCAMGPIRRRNPVAARS